MASSSSSRETYKSPEHSAATKQTANKIFVTNLEPSLPLEALDLKLKEIFTKYCTIVSLEVKRSFNRLYSYAFLEVKEPESVDKIVAECNGLLFEGKKIRIEKQRPPGIKRMVSPDYQHKRYAQRYRRSRSGSNQRARKDRSRSYERRWDQRVRRNSPDSRRCYKCLKRGHFARQCDENKKSPPLVKQDRSERKNMNYVYDRRVEGKKNVEERKRDPEFSRSRDRQRDRKRKKDNRRRSYSSSSSSPRSSTSSRYERTRRMRIERQRNERFDRHHEHRDKVRAEKYERRRHSRSTSQRRRR